MYIYESNSMRERDLYRERICIFIQIFISDAGGASCVYLYFSAR